MGKGTIISGGDNGQYQVQLNYARTQYNNEITRIDSAIADLEMKIAADPENKVLRAQKLSLEKRKTYLIANMPDDETIAAWCADLTENLTGEVGIIGVPGESVDFNIQPGYGGNAAYSTARDGQLVPTISMDAAAAYYNLAMLPGWQKWKPLTRYATITALSGDIADVTLSSAESSQQGLVINQESTIEDVPVDYMDCNGVAFEVGDEVLVEFEGQDFASPKIIGFKSEPNGCRTPVTILQLTMSGQVTYIVFGLISGAIHPINDPDGSGEMTQPFSATTAELNEIAEYNKLGDNADNVEMAEIVGSSSETTPGDAYDNDPADIFLDTELCNTADCGSQECRTFRKTTSHRDWGYEEYLITYSFSGVATKSTFNTAMSISTLVEDYITTGTIHSSSHTEPDCPQPSVPANPYLGDVYYEKFIDADSSFGKWDSIGFPAAYTASGVNESLVSMANALTERADKWLGEFGPLEYRRVVSTGTISDAFGNEQVGVQDGGDDSQIDTFTHFEYAGLSGEFNNNTGCAAIEDFGLVRVDALGDQDLVRTYKFAMHYVAEVEANKFATGDLSALSFGGICALFGTTIDTVLDTEAYFNISALLS